MSKEIDINNICLLSIQDLNTHINDKQFYVARYQRGYRWEKNEVEYLLNDINEIRGEQKYCIQPLTVIESEIGSSRVWELIDGQQRTTTVYLIQAALKNSFFKSIADTFTIKYDTRATTHEFLTAITDNTLKEYLVPINSSKAEKDIEESWSAFSLQNNGHDNIDNYHLFKAYLLIDNWLKKLSDDKLDIFCTKLLEQTYVIWHPITIEDNSAQTVEDFFINMNAGKIQLTSAELVKALFILEIQNNTKDSWDIKEFKKKKLAKEWDDIENELHSETFWFFINNSETSKYPTRIGKLFDIDCKKPTGESNLYAYYHYAKKYNSNELLNWDNIKHIFQRLKEWYEDIKSFHLIGFIINAGICTLEDLILKTAKMNKSDITNHFESIIKKEFKSVKKHEGNQVQVYGIDQLHFQNFYGECRNVLLLYNIRLIEKYFPNQRFPFELFQSEENKWTIEHIHPQTPRGLKDKNEALEWLTDYKLRLEDEDESNISLIDKIGQIEDELDASKEDTISQEITGKIKEVAEELGKELDIHSIGNQALLDQRTNSKIGNKGFLSKRNLIIEASNNESKYIPLGTLYCFLKKTTKSGGDNNFRLNYWSSQDAEDYTANIQEVLNDYLPLNKSE